MKNGIDHSNGSLREIMAEIFFYNDFKSY